MMESTKFEMMRHVLLCGGAGTRLWPLSTHKHPKQLVPLFDGKSLLQMAAIRNLPFCKDIVAVAAKDQVAEVQQQLFTKGIEPNIIGEPVGRNTAAAIAIAALLSPPGQILLVTPADHLIGADDRYEKAVQAARELADQGWLVTFGLKPLWPEVGYGYIQYEGTRVIRFTEKPVLSTATEMIASGNYLWNSGIFCFKASVILDALAQHCPEVLEASQKAVEERNATGEISLSTMQSIPSISIDYAVMEHSQKVAVVSTDMQWSDVGSFETLANAMGELSTPVANIALEGTANNATIGTRKPVFFVGANNLIVVESEQAILVLQQGQGQQVKALWEWIKENRPEML